MDLPEKLHAEQFTLSNGMGVVVCPRPHLHRISMMLNINAGCRDETKNGTAHMLEHLIFRGTDAYPSLRALSEAFETRGADFNAFTAREVTSFEIVTPPESLDEVLELLGDALLRPKLTGISAERDIIREEILADYDNDGKLINEEDLLIEAFYGPAGQPIAGNPEDLDKITKDDVLDFYDQNYRAQRMTLVVVGPISNTKHLLHAISHAFADIKPQVSARAMRPMTPEYFHAIQPNAARGSLPKPKLLYRLNEGATQSEITLGFLCSSVKTREFYVLSMLSRVLDDGMASRLSRRLIEELAIVYDAEACLSVTAESTLLQIRASCRHRRVPKLIRSVYELLAQIAKDGIDDEEFDRIKRRVIWEHRALLDGGASLCSWISSMLMQDMTTEPASFCADLLEVRQDEIQQIAHKLLDERPHIVSIVGELGQKTLDAVKSLVEK